MRTIKEEIKQINKRNEVISTLQKIAEEEGYIKVESDAFEEYSLYLDQNPRQNPKKLVKVPDLQGNMYFLQPDLTINIIKQVIPRIQSDESLELYYIEKVYQFKDDGSIEATRQFGIELIGQNGMESDVSVIQLIQQILQTFHVMYKMELGNQEWINTLIQELQLSKQIEKEFKQALYTKNKKRIFQLIPPMAKPGYTELLEAILMKQNDTKLYKAIVEEYNLSSHLLAPLNKTEYITDVLQDSNIEVDLSLVNEFDYYNGPIFKVYINDYKEAILRGGRYDYLTQDFGQLTPALGFSLDVDVFIKEV